MKIGTRLSGTILLPFLALSLSGTASRADPVLSFFNEMKGPEVRRFFEDARLIPTLQALRAEIRMGMIDLTPERAQVLRRLNEAGIPVVAWLLLPEEQGYWFHSGNGKQAIERYKDVEAWAEAEGIHFEGIGIDLELDINDAKLARSNPWALVRRLPARLYDKERITEGRRVYGELLRLIHQDGLPVESYFAPFIKDEARIGSTAIQQLTGVLDVPVEREIPMLYTSFMGNPYGMLKVYALDQHAPYVALGSTGGGVGDSSTFDTLTWEQLAHDIRMVAPVVKEIHIFSLEGCVQQRYLDKLVHFDYDQPVAAAPKEVDAVKSLQRNVLRVSRILSHPTLLFGSLILLVTLWGWGVFRLLRLLVRKRTAASAHPGESATTQR
jgi:hypothetical protein